MGRLNVYAIRAQAPDPRDLLAVVSLDLTQDLVDSIQSGAKSTLPTDPAQELAAFALEHCGTTAWRENVLVRGPQGHEFYLLGKMCRGETAAPRLVFPRFLVPASKRRRLVSERDARHFDDAPLVGRPSLVPSPRSAFFKPSTK